MAMKSWRRLFKEHLEIVHVVSQTFIQEDFSKEPQGDQLSKEILAKYAVSPVNVCGWRAEGRVVMVSDRGGAF